MRHILATITASAAALLLSGCSFMNNPGPVLPDNTDDQVQPARTYTAAEHWDALAQLVERGEIRHTDELIWIAERLQSMEYISDISRIDSYRPKMEKIDESNRDFIANALRGA